MTASNYPDCLAFVWKDQYDSPAQGYHVTPHDAGGGTYGGVIETTWAAAVHQGLVTGTLRNATRVQLGTILRANFWGAACDALPVGLDLMLFNGKMQSGGYSKIFQQCLGLTDDDVDGDIGPQTLKVAMGMDPATLIQALTGAHYTYLKELSSWAEFKNGWTARLMDVRQTALGMLQNKQP